MTLRPAPRPTFRHAALLAFGAVSLFFACAAPEASSDKVCKPQEYYYCRCRDRTEGQKLCRDDGRSYGACEPCANNSLGPGDEYDAYGYEEDPDASEGETDGGLGNSLCGNGMVESGEDCDDDNADETDGCNSECKLAGKTPFKTNACPGLEVHAWGGKHKPTLQGSTVGSGNRRVTPACGSTSGQTAPDRVFRVVAHATGTMKVRATEASFDVFLWASATCDQDENTYLVCANAAEAGAAESLSFSVQAGKTYYVFVDGAGPDSSEGDFRLTISIE